MKLTKSQRSTLQHAARIVDDGEYDGVSPVRGGQRKMYTRLEALGLLITDAGRRLLDAERAA